MEHLTRTLEDACQIMRHSRASADGAVLEGCIWVIDFKGYSLLKDSNPRTGLLAARLLAHYPERLGRALLVDAPRVFAGTFAAVTHVLNEHTTSKIRFVSSTDGSLETEIAEWASEELQRWLRIE